MVYKINLRFRRFGCGTGQLTGLKACTTLISRQAPAPRPLARAHDLAETGKLLGPATISPCTITMDHDAIICSMIDGLARGPDQDVHARAWAAKSTLLASRCHILVIDYLWGSMGSNETATATTGGPQVIDVFDGNGAPSGPNCTLFSGADRLADALWDRSGVG